MACMSKEAMILKSDAGGRVVVPVERQLELVREFERSGLPGTRFAVMAGLKYQKLASWRRIGYHPACAGRWVSGGEPSVPDPLSPRPRATPSTT